MQLYMCVRTGLFAFVYVSISQRSSFLWLQVSQAYLCHFNIQKDNKKMNDLTILLTPDCDTQRWEYDFFFLSSALEVLHMIKYIYVNWFFKRDHKNDA